jgi:hypothetical protein
MKPLNRKQVAVATAQILFQRFWYTTSMKQFGIGVSPACIPPDPISTHYAGHWNGRHIPRIQTRRMPAPDA